MKKLLSLCLIALLSACQPESGGFNGYVEGEYLFIAPTTPGLLAELSVKRGQKVAAGDPLFALDVTTLKASQAQAKAEQAQANAKWNDLLKGKRPEEIEIILQQQQQARIALDNAEKEFVRSQKLIASKAVSQQAFDNARTVFVSAQARLAEVEAQLKTAALGAREDEVLAAKAAIDIADQKIVQLDKQLADAAPKAPASGAIEDTFFNPGEYIAAGKPVVSLLPPDKVKVRFFVPQARLPELPIGKKVAIGCDGCGKRVAATISFVGTQTEYTPPVIYSIGSRDRLVFLVEATPDAYDPVLRLGLPVDILTDQP